MRNPITVATTWAKRGLPSFPIAIGWDEEKGRLNKRPLTPHGHHDASTDPDIVRDWFVQVGGNLRDGEELGTGLQPAGHIVGDCDRHGTGDGPAYADSIGLNGTWTVDTPSNGEHRYYLKPAGATYSNHTPDAWHGLIDVRADGGWVVAPGTQTSWGEWKVREPWNPTHVHPLPPHIAAMLRPANPGTSWRHYQPNRDDHRLNPATIETHTILTNHYGIDPQRTTIRDAPDQRTGEIHTVLDVVRPGKSFGTSGTIGYISPGGLWVFTDAWPDLAPNRGYSPDELVMKARGPWQPAAADDIDDSNPFGYIDWAALWTTDTEDREDLIPGLWTVGAAGSIYSPAGAGKSLLGLEWAACLALGLDILGEPVTPRTVLYLDLENDEHLIRERLEALGLAEQPIPNLHYSLLGDWQPLDTAPGGATLLAEATRLTADIVIIDTTSRVINGEENNADTFLALFRHTMRPLKAAGIATLRLDHAGKDLTKGERGSSAKRSDVDLTYRLTILGEAVVLQRQKNRLHLPDPQTLTLTREQDPLRHVIRDKDNAEAANVADLIATLDRLDVPSDAGNHTARKTLKAAGEPYTNAVLLKAVRARKNQPKPFRAARNGHGTVSEDRSEDRSKPFRDRSETVPRASETVPSSPAPSRGLGTERSQPQTCDRCGQPLYLQRIGRTRCARCTREAEGT